MKKENHIKVLEFWTRHKIPYIWDETLSLYQLVRKTIQYLNKVIEDQNELKDIIKEFIQAFEEDLQDTVIEILEQWKDDGSLKEIINEALFESKLDKAEFEKFKNTHEISPDDYDGTDFQKVQKAIDDAVKNNFAVRFARVYDITGDTIVIDKHYQETREPTALIGAGGGLLKRDSGYMFTGKENNTGDIYTSNMRFYGSRNNTVVWNGNRIIRVNSLNDYYHKIKVFEAKERFAQSIKMLNFTVVYNDGWAFEWKNSFDVILQGMIEHGESGIRNTSFTNNPDNFNLKIDCCIEGMKGTAISLGSCGSTTISGYQEANGDYLILNNSKDFHTGLTVERCVLDPTLEQRQNNKKCIKWGNVGNGGAFSYSNYSTGDLHEVRELTGKSTGLVNSIADQANGILASNEGSPKEAVRYGFRDLNDIPKITGSVKGLTQNAWQIDVSKENLFGWHIRENVDPSINSIQTKYYGGFSYKSELNKTNFIYKTIPSDLVRNKEIIIKFIARRVSGSSGLVLALNDKEVKPSSMTQIGSPIDNKEFKTFEHKINIGNVPYLHVGFSGGGADYTMEIAAFDVWVNEKDAKGYSNIDPFFSL